MADKKAKTEEPTEVPVLGTTASAGVIDRWGPFEEYTYVTNQYGDYGLQAGLVLTFEMKERLNRDTFEMETVPVPIRRAATADELAQYGVTLEKQKPNMQLMEQAAQKAAPQLMEITINDGKGTFPGVLKQAPVVEDH